MGLEFIGKTKDNKTKKVQFSAQKQLKLKQWMKLKQALEP